MDKTDAMLETAERIIKKHFGCRADEIGKVQNATNNFVYFFSAAGNPYFLKLYRSKNWPEEGKVSFVYRSLSQNHIPCAELIAYCRNDEAYPNGYLIERKIQGTAADKIHLDSERETRLYGKLAELVSSVHGIRMQNFGYIGGGIANYPCMTDFFADEFDGFDEKLKDILSKAQLKKLKETVLDTMRDYADLPSVLCHGDLSMKNVILRDHGELSLIDWDDAMALNWMADVSRLTFWMKQRYREKDYARLRSAFLAHYRASSRKDRFDDFESAYHIYAALDFLIFSIRVGNREMENRLKSCFDGFIAH